MTNTLSKIVKGLFLTWLILTAIGFYFTLPPVDEGMLLSAVKRFSAGEIPYKDFFLYVPPISLLVGIISENAHSHIFYPRLLAIITSFVSLLLYYKYLRIMFPDFSSVVRISFPLYVISTIPISFVYSHHNLHHFFFTILLLILSTINFNIIEKKDRLQLVALGATIGIIGLTSQAAGFYYALGIGAIFIIFKLKDKVVFILLPLALVKCFGALLAAFIITCF